MTLGEVPVEGLGPFSITGENRLDDHVGVHSADRLPVANSVPLLQGLALLELVETILLKFVEGVLKVWLVLGRVTLKSVEVRAKVKLC